MKDLNNRIVFELNSLPYYKVSLYLNYNRSLVHHSHSDKEGKVWYSYEEMVYKEENDKMKKCLIVVDYQNESKSILQVGDKISTYIIKFNPADKRIALSVHEASAEPAQESTEE